jgi:hypothetical protein
MQDYRVAFYQHHQKQEISQRTQNLLDSLKDVWERLQKLPHENMQSILEIAARFPEPYSAPVLQSIAEKLVSSMAIHYLDILATFSQKAGQEGFDVEEQVATITESMAELLPILTGLSSRLAVRTLDDVATLAAITVGLYGLSHTESAEQAQHWLYVLPRQYVEQLAQEHLLATPSFQFSVTVHLANTPARAELPKVQVSFADSTAQLAPHHSQLTVPSATAATQHLDTPTTESSTALAA